MTLTITEVLNAPKGMDFTEYETLLEEKKRLEKKIRCANMQVYDAEASLEVLADEIGSERYNLHARNRHSFEVKKQKALERLREIEEKLK